jgi:hypothetical protein
MAYLVHRFRLGISTAAGGRVFLATWRLCARPWAISGTIRGRIACDCCTEAAHRVVATIPGRTACDYYTETADRAATTPQRANVHPASASNKATGERKKVPVEVQCAPTRRRSNPSERVKKSADAETASLHLTRTCVLLSILEGRRLPARDLGRRVPDDRLGDQATDFFTRSQ